MVRFGIALCTVVCLAVALNSCTEDSLPINELAERSDGRFPVHFPPITLTPEQDRTQERIILGRILFFDSKLSGDSTVSCATCHLPEKAFTDGLPITRGVGNRFSTRNSPSLANIAWATSLQWDGSARTLEEQIWKPIENPNEMGTTRVTFIEKVKNDKNYRPLFENAYDQLPDERTIALALAAYQRVIISAESPYDMYVTGGTLSQMSAAALRGMDLFYGDKTGCEGCHSGHLQTNFSFQNNGLAAIYSDIGRAGVTGNPADIGKFKVPGLRNLKATAPYMHDGSLATLDDVLNHYVAGGAGHVNQSPMVRPFVLTQAERTDMLAFFEALSDSVFLSNPSY